ncbi:MAG: hypothetical protein IJ153_03720 [Clostridia bacterium]|nr:hypothetical protein [Clostridia bacterium]
MNEYRGKHSPSMPWAVSSTASRHYRSRHAQRHRRRRQLAILGAVLLVILLVLPFVDALILRVDRVSLISEDLPADIGHLRIVYLSDVDYGFFFSNRRVNSLVNTIVDLKPDIVLFGGDIGNSPDDALSFYQRLPSLHARYAALGVLGEKDHGETDTERDMVTDAMRDAGVVPLVNDLTAVRIGSSLVYIAGLDDVRTGKPTLTSLASKTAAEDYVVFLCHNPSIIPDIHRAEDKNGKLGWFDLALFGHTHGGQIWGLSGLLGIATDVDDRYLGGWLVENRSDLLISNGVGTSVIPARVFTPPQIHCIDISRP